MNDRFRPRKPPGPLFEAGRQLLKPAPPAAKGAAACVLPPKHTKFWRGVWAVFAVIAIGAGLYYGRALIPAETTGTFTLTLVPPAYTHRAPIVLFSPDGAKAHIGGFVEVPKGSVLAARYDGVAPPSLSLDGADQTFEKIAKDAYTLSLPFDEAPHVATLTLGNGWHSSLWRLRTAPDEKPRIVMTALPQIMQQQTVRLAFEAADDYGVRTVSVRVRAAEGDGAAVERMMASPDLARVKRALYEDLTGIPFAGSRVRLSLVATDDAGQRTETDPVIVSLPRRAFRHPLARALEDEREKLMASSADDQVRNEVIGIMAGMARQEDSYGRDLAVLMALRAGAVRLILDPTPVGAADVASLMWDVAVRIETGPLGRAQDTLRQAERDLLDLLDRGAMSSDLLASVERLDTLLSVFLDAMLSARAPVPPPMSDRAFVLQSEKDYLTREDLRNMLADIKADVASGVVSRARGSLEAFADTLENLHPIAPDLSVAQRQLLQQAAQLREMAFSQKRLRDQMVLSAKAAGRVRVTVALRQKWAAQQNAILEHARTLVAMDPEAVRAMTQAMQNMADAAADLARGAVQESLAEQGAALESLEKATRTLVAAARRTMLAQPETSHAGPGK